MKRSALLLATFALLLPLGLAQFAGQTLFAQAASQTAAQTTAQTASQTASQTGLAKTGTAQTGTPAATSASAAIPVTLPVTLPVTVLDKRGAPVTNLTKDDFELQVDGTPQTIQSFAQETNQPITVGLLVDTSAGQRNVLNQERTASRTFVDQMMTGQTQAFLIHFDKQVELLQDITNQKGQMDAGLDLLAAPQQSADSGGSSGPAGATGGATLYDAAFLAADELMKKQKGRKVLVLVTDGVDTGSRETVASAIDAAQKADTVVYAVLVAGEQRSGFGRGNNGNGGNNGGNNGSNNGGMGRPGIGFPGGGGWPGSGGGQRNPGGNNGGQQPGMDTAAQRAEGKKVLQRMCAETGGGLFEVSRREPIDAAYADIGNELQTQYLLGYTPDKAASAAGFHNVSLVPKDAKKYEVQTRAGYYAGK